MMTAALAAAVSCTDYSDWNSVPGDTGAPTAGSTLWQSLEAQPELSDFMQVLQQGNVAPNLSATRFYTIWAPVNGSFNLDSVLQCSDDAILAQFINNHIAEYNHQATGNLVEAERVKTLNSKTYNFLFDERGYTYNDVPLATDAEGNPLYNLPCSNGTLHMIEGNSPFLPNGFEALSMLKEELKDGTSAIDKIADYILQYNDTALDTRNSVPGSIVDGKQTYLDSVFTVSNIILSRNRANARVENEDSTYSILLPNDQAYDDYYTKVKRFYRFLDGLKWQNVAESQSTTTYPEQTITAATVGTDLAYLSDSLAKRAIIDNLFYSNNHPYNMHLVKPEAENFNDTVVTTLRAKYSNGDELFDEAHILHTQHLSNGYAYVVDTLSFKPWESYNKPITINGTNFCRVISEQSRSNVRLSEENTNTDLVDISDGNSVSYVWAQAATRGKPEVDYYLSGVKATTYNVYCVIPPANVDLRDSITVIQPNILNFTYQGYYANEKGTAVYGTVAFSNERFEAEEDGMGPRVTGVPETAKKTSTNTLQATDFVNDTSKVDTMYLGKITIPYCYAGLGYSPNIKVTNSGRINVLSTASNRSFDNYTRDIRICAILLRPLDYEEYLAEEEKKNANVEE